ncbi:MAG: RIP metalloprotease RseP [Deltaproteobacteria bacterium]
MAITSILGAVAVLAVVIFVHELGHFLVAKRVGVDVLVFSLGFGPTLLSRTVGETEYRLSLIPLGGYVRMAGQDDLGPAGGEDGEAGGQVASADESEGDPTRRFSAKSLSSRAAIVLAGPGVNYLFAVLIFTVVAFVYGQDVPAETARVGRLMDGGPAATAGLRAGDTVTSIDGTEVATWDEMATSVRGSQGRSLLLRVESDQGDSRTVNVSPERRVQRDILGEAIGEAWMIGIERGVDTQEVGIIEAARLGARSTWFWTEVIFATLGRLFQGRLSPRDLGGPIMIAQEAGRRAASGLKPLLLFTALISVNLGIINILPIPVLDGGHLFFFLIEGLRGKPVSLRYREIAQQVGIVMMVALMIFVVYNDIARIIGG